jgi:hypothetical protein
MTPRHPPRALRSLTTPIRPPPGKLGTLPGAAAPDLARSASRLRGPRRHTTRRPPPVTMLVLGSARPRGASQRLGPFLRVIPRSWRDCATTTLARLCVACVTNHRIVRELRPKAAPPPRTPERPDRGARIGPTGRWPGGEAALDSAPPRAQRGSTESGAMARTRRASLAVAR